MIIYQKWNFQVIGFICNILFAYFLFLINDVDILFYFIGSIKIDFTKLNINPEGIYLFILGIFTV